MILVDTDIVVDVIRNHPPAVAWLNSIAPEQLVISGFSSFELFAWCRDGSEQQRLSRELIRYQIAWPSQQGCALALQTYQRFHLSHGVGAFDTLIGQTALDVGVPLHTFNVKHFQVVPSLQTIQPYVK